MRSSWILCVVLGMFGCVLGGHAPADDVTGEQIGDPDCGPLPAVVSSHLQDIVEAEQVNARSLGMNLGARLGCRTWVGSSGAATLDHQTALTPDDRFRIYSITKTFTAALIYRLVDRGLLSLDAPLSRWYPNVPNATKIRIRHLLSHTSGLYDCLVDERVVEHRNDAWDHDELISIAASHGPQFEPGAEVAYVNTNFLILGRIIEQVTGRTYTGVLRSELLDPLGLRDTFVAGYEDELAYVQGSKHTLLGNLTDATDAWNDTLTWSAGALVSSARDQLTWFTALFGDTVLSEASRAMLVTPPVLADGSDSPLGHGVTVSDSPEGPYYSHDGGGAGIDLLAETAFGFHAHVGFLRDKQLVLVVLANTGTSDVAGARNAAMRYLVWGY